LKHTNTATESAQYLVVHPLDAEPEEKRSCDGLGQIEMTTSVRAAFITLRIYLVLIFLLTLYRFIGLANVYAHP
jgi:hypothetical protein